MILDRVTEGYDEQPMLYEDMYRELRDWAHGSLDFYKGELHSVLYPHLVHCFLEMVRRGAAPQARKFLEKYGEEFMANSPTCAKELRSLMGVSSPQIMAENETAKLFLNNRFELMLSSYALELLLAFLTDNPRRYLLLRILNHKCRIIDQTLPTVRKKYSLDAHKFSFRYHRLPDVFNRSVAGTIKPLTKSAFPPSITLQ